MISGKELSAQTGHSVRIIRRLCEAGILEAVHSDNEYFVDARKAKDTLKKLCIVSAGKIKKADSRASAISKQE